MWSRHARRTLPRNRSQVAFCLGAVGRAQLLDAARRRDLGERPAELPVVIVDEIPGPPAIGRGLTQLLRDPGVGRLPRHPDVDHAARAERDDDERGQRAEEEVRHRQEVAGPDLGGVVAQEGRPRLPARPRGARTGQVGLDRALGHADAEIAQLAANPLGPPARVLGRQPPDQGDSVRGEGRASWPGARLPPPERAESRPMPAQQRLRPDDQQGPPPRTDPAGEEHQECPIRPRQGRTRDAVALHQQLLAQEGVLGKHLRPAAEQVRPCPRGMGHGRRSRPEARTESLSHTGNDHG
jgi:hypothetical protein